MGSEAALHGQLVQLFWACQRPSIGVAGKAAPHGVHEGAKNGREVEREERKD